MAGNRMLLRKLVPKPFGIVHLVWAVLILAGCVLFATTGGGHPPPIILVPPLLAIGLLVHLLLLLAGWLVGKARARKGVASL
jgi:hypothetical protein